MKKEESLQISICNYVRLQYPSVIFMCDTAAGMKLTIGNAVKAKKMRSSRGQPDLFIAKPVGKHSGLFLELKTAGTKLYKLNNEYATPHISEQAKVLDELNQLGYLAFFAVGFDDAKEKIDRYLKPL